MSEQENLAHIEKLTKQLAHMTSERNLHQTLHLSLECAVKDLEKEIRMQKTTISNYDQHVQANALKMLQLSERICELEISGAPPPAAGASEREKELQSELQISQRARNELHMEFEAMRDRHEESQIRAFFFQIMFEFDTTETKSLTVEQFDKKIKCFFTRFKDMYPEDKQKSSDEAKRAWKFAMTRIHPDKNPNDTFAGEKFKVFNAAYQQFKE
jgi:septal ring factor EnvC (AmiA/AmiB activator)